MTERTEKLYNRGKKVFEKAQAGSTFAESLLLAIATMLDEALPRKVTRKTAAPRKIPFTIDELLKALGIDPDTGTKNSFPRLAKVAGEAGMTTEDLELLEQHQSVYSSWYVEKGMYTVMMACKKLPEWVERVRSVTGTSTETRFR